MSTAVLLTTAKTQKQPECPSTEWMKTTRPTYMVEYHSAIQKNEVMTFATIQMDLEIITPSEASQKE